MCHQSIIPHVYLMFNTCLLENVDVNHQIQKSIKYFISISSHVESHYFLVIDFLTDMKSNGYHENILQVLNADFILYLPILICRFDAFRYQNICL